MKQVIYIFLLISQVIWSQTGFEEGNALYRKEKYEAAAEAYEKVFKTKKHSAELYFNLGNCYYKLNRVAPAIYNLEKAKLLDPDDRDIANNLKFAQKLMIDEAKETPKVGFKKIIGDFTSAFHFDTWAWISVGVAFLFIGLFVGYYFSYSALYKRIFFISMFVAIFLFAISVLAAIFERSRVNKERPAIIFAETAAVKSEPRENAGEVAALHEGSKVYVIEVLDDWKRVELPGGNDGWIEAKAIKELK